MSPMGKFIDGLPTHNRPAPETLMRITDLLSPRELSRVGNLQFLARGIVEGFCSGKHRSPHKGFSVEFKEHRQYVRGDELRNIDWKVFGKSDRLFIREYEEETNLRCTLLVDRSGSMSYKGERSDGKTKYDYGVQLAAALTYLMLGQQDAVGLITFDDQPRDHIPVRSRPSHLQNVLKALTSDVSYRETDLGGVFRQVAPKISRRGLVIIISDSMGDVSSIAKSLAQFRASRHEIIFFQILDPDEVDFPFAGRVQFKDLEDTSNEHTVDARSLKDAYIERLELHQQQLRDACQRNRVDFVPMTTDRPFSDALHEYMAFRRRMS